MNIELLRRRQPALSVAQESLQNNFHHTTDIATDTKSETTIDLDVISKLSQPKEQSNLPILEKGFGYALLSSMGITEETPLIPYEG